MAARRVIDSRLSNINVANRRIEGGIGGSAPVYVQAYSTTDISGVVEFLKEVESDGKLASAVALCAKIWYKYRCEEGHFVLKPRLCRERRWCPRDAEVYVKLKVNHALENFERIEGWRDIRLYLIHLVFTFPQEIWQDVVRDPDPAFECVYEALMYPSGLSGGVAALHLTHSSEPLRGWYPHIHVIVPNVVVVKNGGLRWFRRARPYFNERLLKKRFAEALKKRYSVEVESDLYVQYVRFSDKARVKHILKYAFRLPIMDLAPYLKAGLSDEVKKWVVEVVNYPRKRIRWFGWLADGVKNRYMVFERFEDWLKRYEGLCPIHRCRLLFVGYVFELKGCG